MHVKTIAIIILITLAIVITPKPVMASPDTYYLEDGDVLTTEKPSDPYTIISIPREGTYNNTWFSSSISGDISAGTYNFIFWMNASASGVRVDVTFTFGYYYEDKYYQIVTVTGINIDLSRNVASYILSGSGSQTSIPEGSRLYLNVFIKNNHPAQSAYFYYSGNTYSTRIETPSIIVPEFPMGVFLLLPMLLTLYLILRRCLPKP